MPPKQTKVSLKTQLERAERKGHKKGMTDLLALLAAADDGFIPDYSDGYEYGDFSWHHRARVDAAMLNAAEDNEIELMLFFVKAGADVNAYNGEHCTALDCAVEEGNIKLVKALLKAGASLNPRKYDDYYHDDDTDYVSPLESAVKQGNLDIVKVLLAAGALPVGDEAGEGNWLINYSAEGDQVELTRAFIKAGAYLGSYDYNESYTPLMLALIHGKAKAAALLIKAGSDVNAEENDATALMLAAFSDKEEDLEVIRLLLKAGAKVNYKDSDGYTALICAARAGRSEAVRLLLSAGADVFYQAPIIPARWGNPAVQAANAFDLADGEAVKAILKSEMHRRIAAALSVLPLMLIDVRKKIIQLYLDY